MINVLFAARPDSWRTYETALQAAFSRKGLTVNLATQMPADQVDYIVYAPNSTVQDFTPFTRTKAVLNLWAGVENVVGNETLTIPLARMVDHGMTEGMVEWVTGHVLRHHLGMDRHIVNPNHLWQPKAPPLARDRTVAILGLGELGAACAKTLASLNFRVLGWSRNAKKIDGVECHNGAEGLKTVLRQAEISVLLLPLTDATQSLMNAERLGWMPDGAVLINPGRGPLIDDDALLAALDAGQIGHATLDVFRIEPLPGNHPFWAHPHVTVTPHIASETRAETASDTIAENVRRGEAGEPFLYLVDRARGY